MKPEQEKMQVMDGRISVKADIVKAENDKPSYKVITDKDGNIIDYQDVKIEGYANTFTIDRGGDQVVPGAFTGTLEEYMTNPILLIDHVREANFAAGRVTVAYEDEIGLKVMATLSNSPSEKMRDLRFKVAEGVIKTFSIGGRFTGKATQEVFYITKVDLREISIVTVPMNAPSVFAVKSERGFKLRDGEKIHNVTYGREIEPLVIVDGDKRIKIKK